MAQYPKPEARNTNFLFTFGEDPSLTFQVQTANITFITFNSKIFPTREKDVSLPSGKITIDPLVVTFIVSEDFSEWTEILKWGLRNINGPGPDDKYDMRTSELIALDNQNQPTTRFIYGDSFPIALGGIDFQVNTEGSQVIVADATFLFQRFSVVDQNGDLITEEFYDYESEG